MPGLVKALETVSKYTPGETENEWQKTEQVPILLLRGARSFFDAKKIKKKFASLDFGNNPIYPFWDADGRDLEFFFEMSKDAFFKLSNFAIMSYGNFPTRNGLKLRKLSTFTSLRINNSLRLFILRLVSTW